MDEADFIVHLRANGYAQQFCDQYEAAVLYERLKYSDWKWAWFRWRSAKGKRRRQRAWNVYCVMRYSWAYARKQIGWYREYLKAERRRVAQMY